jgi:hypothetical protein
MAINFPNAPTNGTPYTEGSVTWEYQDGNWTVISGSSGGVENGTNYDDRLVYLERVGSTNQQRAADGLSYNISTHTLTAKALSSGQGNILTITNSGGTTINAIGPTGVLQKAGRVYFSTTTPETQEASNTGVLWHKSDTQELFVWNGTSWVSALGAVGLANAQTITGIKTFHNANLVLSGTTNIYGTGLSKSISINPTDASGNHVEAIAASSSQVSFNAPVNFSAVGLNVKTVLVTLVDDQTIAGVKTFSSNAVFNSLIIGDSLTASTSTSSLASTDNVTVSPSQSATGRKIRLFSNSDSTITNGIQVRPKNESGLGDLNIDGNTVITGNLSVSGTISSTSAATVTPSASYGSFKSKTGANAQNVDMTPRTLGPLSFTFTADTSTWLPYFTVTNNSAAPLRIYWSLSQNVKADDETVVRVANRILQVLVPAGPAVSATFRCDGVITAVSGTWTTEFTFGHGVGLATLDNGTNNSNIPILSRFELCP